MIKRILVLILFAVMMGGCNLKPQKAAIEIVTYPSVRVFIDNREAGMTPYKNNSLKPGEISLKLVPEDEKLKEWSRKVSLHNLSTTVVDWEFGEKEDESSGYVLFMEEAGNKEESSLIVNVDPADSAIKIDGEVKGFSPTQIQRIESGDKQIDLSFPAYKNKSLFVKFTDGFQLVVDAKLAKSEITDDIELEIEKELVMEKTTESTESARPYVKIKETETGWLRVRKGAGSDFEEIKKANPGEEYKLVSEEAGWCEIKLDDDETGWVSEMYVDKFE
ncbi:SH3 domain-containing protein [Patescibacteria group bacterium]|nr:SH3 domain-containing protein [Patescibacteria group bacterium]MCG2702639.1 SH3 domain-containing protein [Candidatus Parcubacteria bacterium]MBU4209931.1 SH3 domain-containing protein [Patescibacteria group bacterium]MBU4265467.1 SH3 domain-containing protein [Patescibacteria group bacterium]MBU4390517.1 SH3 domain-containing protein [Patescibacteria group bacterium]